MKLILFLFSLMITSCATKKVDKKYKNVPKEVMNIQNEEFDLVRPVNYVPIEDKYMVDNGVKSPLNEGQYSYADLDVNEDIFLRLRKECKNEEFKEFKILVNENYSKYKEHPSYWNLVGNCYLSKKKYKKAILYYNYAIELYSSYSPAYNNLGYIYVKRKEFYKAKEAFNKAYNLSKDAFTPRYNLALLFLQNKLGENALKSTRGLVLDYPNDQHLEKLNILALYQAGAWRDIVKVCDADTDLENEVYLLCSYAHLSLDQKEQAKTYFRKVSGKYDDLEMYKYLEGLKL